jgi:hypothetical protein
MRESIALESELIARGERPAQQIYTRTGAILCLAELGDFREGIARGQEAIRIAETADRPYALAHACFGLGFLYLRQGELGSADRVLQRGLKLCGGFDAPLLGAALGALLGYAQAMSGRLTEGKPVLDDAVGVLAHTLHSESGSLILLGEAGSRKLSTVVGTGVGARRLQGTQAEVRRSAVIPRGEVRFTAILGRVAVRIGVVVWVAPHRADEAEPRSWRNWMRR